MIAVDTNILVYAHRRPAAEHPMAVALMAALCAGAEPWAIPWPCVYEFYNVVTNPKIWKSDVSSPQQAWDQLEFWFEAPAVRLLAEHDGFAAVLGPVLRGRVRGAKVHDARIAALCLAHGIDTLYSRDRDFSSFPELRVVDPFARVLPDRASERAARYGKKRAAVSRRRVRAR